MRLFSLLLSLIFVSPALANHSWNTYHWARKSNPFTLQIGNNLTNTYTGTISWRILLTYVSQDWNTPSKAADKPYTGAPVLYTSVVYGSAGLNCSPVAGTVQVCNRKYGSTGWLGIAQVWTNQSSHILQALAKMNDTYFVSGSKYNTDNEKRHVICQEVAHTFGLDHQSTNGTSQNSCMDYFMNIGAYAYDTRSTRPNYHDFEQLSLMYNHTDATNSYAVTTLAAINANISDDPRDWGILQRQSKNGRSSIYSTSKGGIRIETHVTWTEEKASKCPSCDHRFE